VTATRGQGTLAAMSVPPHEGASALTAEPPPHRTLVSNAVLVLSLLVLCWVLIPIWKALLFASILAATLIRPMNWLSHRLRDHRYVAAAIMDLGVVVLILAPLTIAAVIIARQAIEAVGWARGALEHGGLHEVIRPLPDGVERLMRPFVDRLPREIRSLSKEPTGEAGRWAALQLQNAISTVSEFAFDLVMMLIALFFLLADGHRLADWLRRTMPIGRARTEELIDEFSAVSRAVLGANFITGLAQAFVATIGYYFAHVPQPLFFGLLTLMTSFIPSVGTAMIWLPLTGLLLLLGQPWSALQLAAWSLVLVSTTDNFLRPMLIRGDLHVHGALIFFVMIGGIGVFGVAGLVVGPMVLALFLTMMRFYRRDARRAGTAEATGTVTKV
jgi:predicted PurR-regulated permease PerM